MSAKRNTRTSSKKITHKITDNDFKANYSPIALQKQTTLVLKTSFHLINYILMGMCQVFKNIHDKKLEDEWVEKLQERVK